MNSSRTEYLGQTYYADFNPPSDLVTYAWMKPLELQGMRGTANIALVIAFSVLCCIGLIGNGYVIYVLVTILKQNSALGSGHQQSMRTLQLFILALSTVDTVVLVALPLIIIDLSGVPWFMGNVVCKIILTSDYLNKGLSMLFLLAVCCHCYITVCQDGNPLLQKWKNSKNFALGVIGSVTTIGLLLMLPVMMNSRVMVIYYIYPGSLNVTDPSADQPQHIQYTDFPNATLAVVARKCVNDGSVETIELFSILRFAIAFVFPTTLQICLYTLVICHVYRHSTKSTTSTVDFWKVVRTCILLLTFFLFCWIPYWITLISQPGHSPLLTLVIHLLPYLNAAVNPSLYTFLNKSIQTAYKQVRESLATKALQQRAAKECNSTQKRGISNREDSKRNAHPPVKHTLSQLESTRREHDLNCEAQIRPRSSSVNAGIRGNPQEEIPLIKLYSDHVNVNSIVINV